MQGTENWAPGTAETAGASGTRVIATPVVGIPDGTLSPMSGNVRAEAAEALRAQIKVLQQQLQLLERPVWPPDVKLKRCCRCGENFPADPAYFPRNKARRDGLGERCKPCNRTDVHAWVERNRAKVNRQQKKRYWMKRKQGLHRVTRVINGQETSTWKPYVAPAAPVTDEASVPAATSEATEATAA